jgi:tRNA(fMet)-specific endonuclease VapC
VTVRYLLDTNVLSEPIKSTPNARVVNAIAEHDGRIATCSIVWHELRFGCDRVPSSRRRMALQAYLDEVVRPAVTILPYDEAAAWHARERARLGRRGAQVSFAVGEFASIAVVNELILVTANVRDFLRFARLEVVDWS